MARRLIGGDNRWLLPASALLGGAFVLFCDVLSRVLFAPFELPVGIVMSLLGRPLFSLPPAASQKEPCVCLNFNTFGPVTAARIS